MLGAQAARERDLLGHRLAIDVLIVLTLHLEAEQAVLPDRNDALRARREADYQRLLPGTPGAVATLHVAVAVLFVLASATLLKGKIWTGLVGLFVPPLFIVGAIRLARPGSPWARWRYRGRPGKQAKAERREQHLREPVIRLKIRVQDKMTGSHDLPPAEP